MITDGTFVCGLCGESRVGCSLCHNPPLIDNRAELARLAREEREAESELAMQSRAIARAAWERNK